MQSDQYPLDQPFSKLVRAKMERLGLTLDDLAYHLGTSHEFTYRLMRGVCIPSEPVAELIYKLLGFNEEEKLYRLALLTRFRRKWNQHGYPWKN